MTDPIQDGDIYAVVEQRAPNESYWSLVRRYHIPPESDFDKLFGIGDGSIAAKGKPDNVSTGTAEWIGEKRRAKQAPNIFEATPSDGPVVNLTMEFTCVTQGTVAKVVGGVPDALLAGGDDDCVSAYFGLDHEWHDNSRASTYRLVLWRMTPADVRE